VKITSVIAALFASSLLAQQDRIDQGPLDLHQRLSGMTLMFKKSAAQQADLERLLDAQQNPSSPEYHAWLTPQQYSDRFGRSADDLSRVTSWLASEGFSVDYVAEGRNWMLFSGSVEQVQRTFKTEIHRYRADGEDHYANTIAPTIPAEFEPVIQTVWGLDDFRLKPSIRPLYTDTNGNHYIGPGDLDVIYNINPLLNMKITGAGQKIVIVGQTDIKLSDIDAYRTMFKLTANEPQTVLVKGSADPGTTSDEEEADLDLEVSGGIAPDATVIYVYSTNVFTSVMYAVSQNLAPIISMSYGGCEAKVSGTVTNADSIRSIAQQANSQGITWVASTGDVGAAGCDTGANEKVASQGLAVQIPASIPEVTAVGGAEFMEGAGTYWSNTSPTSALSYIPEMVWNDTAVGAGLSSGGGGASIFFSKPAWQTGPGVPADNARDIPDIAFTAANDHDPYLIIKEGKVIPIGGTSASTPAFGGMLVLLNQYLVSTGALAKPGLGNINPNLYSLAQTSPSIFHDITTGNNIVPCTAGTPDCINGSLGYSAGPGYDRASGLGSMDINNLALSWSAKPLTGTTTSLNATPATILVTASTVVNATVQAASGTATPTGSVNFSTGNQSLGSANLTGSGGKATASVTVQGNQLVTGANTIKASYSGASAFNASSGTATVTVNVPTTSSAVIPSVTPNPVYEQAGAWFYTAKLTEIAGVATTLTRFTVAGTDYSSQIAAFFGASSIPARGSISAGVQMTNVTAPANITLTFGGADAGGAQWSQQINITLYGPQLSASLVLTSAPGTEVLNPRGDANCTGTGIYQELDLQELNGHEVYLTKFLAAGNDLTANTSTWFGSWRIAPLGTLQARLCWTVNSSQLPTTYQYEIDGIDDQGNDVKTTLSVPFQAAGQTLGSLSASKTDFPISLAPGQSTTGSFNVNLPGGQSWTVAKFPANQTTTWLQVTPGSGIGPGTVTITASAGSLPIGAYQATLVLQSVNTAPQFVNITVSLLVATPSNTQINGVANGASFTQTFAPGMILSVFGANLTNSATPLYAPSVPLPMSLGGVTATINGIPAPFYYASQNQLNIQVPYEVGSGYALLAVINNGQAAAFYFLVADSAPGIFVDGKSAIVPVSTARRGSVLTLFMTGEGDVNPPIATGATPLTSTPLSGLPAPRLKPFTITVAGTAVMPQFVGIPYGLVGETQINFPIPANAPLGIQKVVVTAGTTSSLAALINITP
jgi:uncharacterized protein (TIGR03437 family)